MNRVCPYCGTEVPCDLARPGSPTVFCPGCGHELDLPENPQPTPPPAPPAAPCDGMATLADQLAPGPAAEPIPWEGEAGFCNRLMGTVAAVLFSPTKAFRVPGRPEPRWALTFGLIMVILGSCATLLWSYKLGELRVARIVVIYILVFTPLVAVLGLYLAATLVHFFLWICRGAQQGFGATFRVVGYAQAAAVFQLLPVVGNWIASVWQLVSMTIGLAETHHISRGRAFLALILPLIVTLVLAAVAIVAATGLEISQLRQAFTELGF